MKAAAESVVRWGPLSMPRPGMPSSGCGFAEGLIAACWG